MVELGKAKSLKVQVRRRYRRVARIGAAGCGRAAGQMPRRQPRGLPGAAAPAWRLTSVWD
jgi:hypothetical protein